MNMLKYEGYIQIHDSEHARYSNLNVRSAIKETLIRTDESSTIRNNTASTTSLYDIAHDVRVCNFAANAATRVCGLIRICGDAITIAKL